VFRKVYEKEEGKAAPISGKASSEELKKYFEQVLPNYDKERVYVSDIKRLITWYNLLEAHNLLVLKVEGAENAEENKVEENKEEN
jgi:hypothetical protein